MNKNKLFQKIKNESKEMGIHFNQALCLFALEKAIFKISKVNELYNALIFKGGFLIRTAYSGNRFTVDLDMSYQKISLEDLKVKITSALGNFEKDLDLVEYKNFKFTEITQEKEYPGFRLISDIYIEENKIQSIQMDFSCSEINGFFIESNLDLLFCDETILFKIYSKEQIIAEKLETLISRQSSSTRSKDIYDIVHLFDEKMVKTTLLETILLVFKTRKTNLPLSFLSEFKSFDLSVLEISWKKYEKLRKTNQSFSDLVNKFCIILEKIDKI